MHHKIAKRIFSPVWALCSENVLYLYESMNSETTLDVVCLQSYRSKPGGSQPNRFKFRLEQRVSSKFWMIWAKNFPGLRNAPFLCWQYLRYDTLDGYFRTIIPTVRRPIFSACLRSSLVFDFWSKVHSSNSILRKSITESPEETMGVKKALPVPEFLSINQVSR